MHETIKGTLFLIEDIVRSRQRYYEFNTLSIDLSPVLFFIYSLVLFAARSTKGITRLSPVERASIKLPDEVKEVLIGILLGDAQVKRFIDDTLYIVVKRLKICYDFSILFIYLFIASLKVVYNNPKIEKAKILNENKGKSGIYL